MDKASRNVKLKNCYMTEKSFKNVRFRLEENDESEIQLGYLSTKLSWIAVKPLFKSPRNGWIIEREHPYQQTQFILNDCVSCWLLSFNNDGILVSVKKYFNSCSAPASFLIPESFVVLLPIDTDLPIIKVAAIELKKESI